MPAQQSTIKDSAWYAGLEIAARHMPSVCVTPRPDYGMADQEDYVDTYSGAEWAAVLVMEYPAIVWC